MTSGSSCLEVLCMLQDPSRLLSQGALREAGRFESFSDLHSDSLNLSKSICYC